MKTSYMEELAELVSQIIPLMILGNFLAVLLALMVFNWIVQPLLSWFNHD